MSAPLTSQQDLYNLFISTLQGLAPDLTDTSEGSIVDSLAGVYSMAANEIGKLILTEFQKTFFNLANGPAITGGPDDLQTLAVDHFGSSFARPGATKSTGSVTFSRPTAGAGNILIPQGTVVKTAPDANGVAQRYTTDANATITGTSLAVNVTAVVAGSAGNANSGKITIIESTLLDPTISVTNGTAFGSGTDAQDDSAYRETIRNKIEGLRGATKKALEATAKSVSGVLMATALEVEKNVIEYDTATSAIKIGATYFRIPFVTLYVADSSGTASAGLIALVSAALDLVRALGVEIVVAGASAVTLNWTLQLTLNPAGPNYATFLNDTTLIKNSMTDYLNNLPIGTGFVKATAEAAILAIWGSSGTNDLTAAVTTTPAASVAATASQKIIPGTVVTS